MWRHTPVTLALLTLVACGDGKSTNPTPQTPEECTDDCARGELTCEDADSFRVCGQYDLDACSEPSPSVTCLAGYGCDGGLCVPVCRDGCPVGGALCADRDTLLSCGNFDTDWCREPGGAVDCLAGEQCEAGACVPVATPCADECASGSSACFGDAVRACGQVDADACLDLDTPVDCGQGQMCRDGACVPYCLDDCQSGASQCQGDGVQSCGQHDSDACLEWSPPTACPAGESCSNGACSGTCADECDNPGGFVCNGLGVSFCGEFDSDACRDRSTPTPCPLGTACQSGLCVPSCAPGCTAGAPPQCGADGHSVETCGNF
jgi:hypothetical protein